MEHASLAERVQATEGQDVTAPVPAVWDQVMFSPITRPYWPFKVAVQDAAEPTIIDEEEQNTERVVLACLTVISALPELPTL